MTTNEKIAQLILEQTYQERIDMAEWFYNSYMSDCFGVDGLCRHLEKWANEVLKEKTE